MKILNCIAVDDEPLALGQVCKFIEQTHFLKLVDKFTNAIDALQTIHKDEIDLIFLDIQMPDLTGIELAKLLDWKKNMTGPRIIFTTAFNQFAIEGYKVDALDYLLKPFDYDDFLRAASKASAYAEKLSSNPAVNTKQDKDYLILKVEYQLVRIAFDDILYIEGLKDYVKVHVTNNEQAILSLTSLKALEEKLPPERFLRIHRSYIVSLEKIRAVTKNSAQIGETTIPVSEQYKDPFLLFVNQWKE